MFRDVKQLIQMSFLKARETQSLQDCVKALLDSQTFVDDGNDHADRHGDPGLAFGGIGPDAKEGLDPKVLLDATGICSTCQRDQQVSATNLAGFVVLLVLCLRTSLFGNHTTFAELLRDAGYRTGLIGKSHLQCFTGLPATNRYEPAEGLVAPSRHLRDAIKNNRHTPDYDLEVAPQWRRPLAERTGGDFYGFEHVEVVADHGDRACGDYLLWARRQRPDFDELAGPKNALSGSRINAPQAWRTAVPEELYSTSWIADRTEAWLSDRAASEKPFFLQMSFPDPHHPFTPPGRYWDMYDPADIPLQSATIWMASRVATLKTSLSKDSLPHQERYPNGLSWGRENEEAEHVSTRGIA